MIHSKIWESDQVTSLSMNARLLYIGMFSIADDYGRLRGDARFLKNRIFPFDDICLKDIEALRDEIQNVELIEVYSSGKGVYIYHPNWKKYQKLRIERIKPSEYPDPPSDTCRTNVGPPLAEGNLGKTKKEDKYLHGTQSDSGSFYDNSSVVVVAEDYKKGRSRVLKKSDTSMNWTKIDLSDIFNTPEDTAASGHSESSTSSLTQSNQ